LAIPNRTIEAIKTRYAPARFIGDSPRSDFGAPVMPKFGSNNLAGL
jgi:hypothetical protein